MEEVVNASRYVRLATVSSLLVVLLISGAASQTAPPAKPGAAVAATSSSTKNAADAQDPSSYVDRRPARPATRTPTTPGRKRRTGKPHSTKNLRTKVARAAMVRVPLTWREAAT